MDDLQTQLEEMQTTVDDHADTISSHDDAINQTNDTVDQLSQSLTDIDQRAGQLDFPLTPDSVSRIQELFIHGKFSLVAGTYTLVDPRINIGAIVLYSVIINGLNSAHTTQYSYVLTAGQIVWNSSGDPTAGPATDYSIIGYVIFF